MTPSRALVAAIAASLAVPLTGCGADGPSDAELRAASEGARATVIAISDDLSAAVQDANPDLTFIDNPDPMGEARSWDCSDSPAANGEAIQWASNQTLEVQPTQPTDRLLDPLVHQLLEDGWELTEDETDDLVRVVTVSRDGYHVDLSGDTVVSDDPTWVTVDAFSPCLQAPQAAATREQR